MNNLIHQIVKAMNQTYPPHPIAPTETQEPNPPVEAVTLAPEDLLEPAPPTTQAPHEIRAWVEDRNYAQHWGINE